MPSPAFKRVPNVPTAAQIIQDDAETLGPDARHLAARIGHASLTEIAGYKRQKLLAALPAANEAGSLMQKGNVPGWERQRDESARVAISIFSAEQPKPVIDVTASVSTPVVSTPN